LRRSRLLLRLVAVLCLLGLAALLVIYLNARGYARTAQRRARALETSGHSLRRLPPRWVEAFLAVEDPAFYSHHGVDLRTPGAGWTTITQGLVKIHFPGPYNGPIGKSLQSLRALFLDRMMTKDEQLTLALDTANFGQDGNQWIVGFPAAAQAYYGRPLLELSDDQFLGLVAMLIAPDAFHPRRHPEAHAERVRRIQALVAHRCRPSGWRDVYLEGCAGKT
jgi:membrane peptidoglycan carboxypeptidase